MVLTREQIMERLQTDDVWVTVSRTALTAAVPERKMRYVVGIFLSGDGVSSKTVDIEKLEEDETTYTMKFSMIPVAPADHREIPESGYDIENPIMVLEGGSRPYGKASGNSVNTTIIYWDNEI